MTAKTVQEETETVNKQIDFDLLYREAARVMRPRQLSETAEAGDVGAALLSADGNIYVGVCIDTACSMGFCAEHAAAAAMVTAGENQVAAMIAVDSAGEIIPPCGRCREFISQLAENNLDCLVKVGSSTVVSLRELLPYDWRQSLKG